MNSLIGIDGLAKVTVTNVPSGVSWLPVFSNLQFVPLIVGGHNYGTFAATNLTFLYAGLTSFTNNTSSPISLGTFTVTSSCYSLPVLPGGAQIPVTYSYSTKGDSGSNIAFNFTTVSTPEPSSSVIVALVGTSMVGMTLFRRRRRAA
jgi:hypothetical protein